MPALLLLVAPASALGQTVQFQGRGDPILDDRIRRLLADTSVTLLTSDTLLGRADTLTGPIAAIGISLRIEGTVDGDLYIIDSNVFVRPFGTVRGTVTNIAGAFVPSDFALIEAEVIDHADAPYDVEHVSGGVRIVGLVRRRIFATDGLRGLRFPTYDRVAGLTLGLGAAWYPVTLTAAETRLHGWGGYAFERETWVGGASLGFTGRRFGLELGGERVTATPHSWIRGDGLNTLAVLVLGSDYRDYYGAERAWASVSHFAGDVTIGVEAGIEDAKSLEAQDVWTMVEPDSIRPNPIVNDGRIASAVLSGDASIGSDWVAIRLFLSGEAGFEAAGGDYEFQRYIAEARIAANAFRNHTVELRGRFQGPLGSDSLPRQRWGMLGGHGTLETLPLGALRGDRLALVRTTYAIPLDPVRVPFLGTPVVEAIHAIGSAWSMNTAADFSQALGARLHFPFVYFFAFFDPEGDHDSTFGVGIRFRRRLPWEEERF